MTNIQKKSLEHISKVLKSFDTYPVYRTVIEVMDKEEIANGVKTIIGEKVLEAMDEQKEKVTEAKEWVDSLIEDCQ